MQKNLVMNVLAKLTLTDLISCLIFKLFRTEKANRQNTKYKKFNQIDFEWFYCFFKIFFVFTYGKANKQNTKYENNIYAFSKDKKADSACYFSHVN